MRKVIDIALLKDERKYWKTVEESCLTNSLLKTYQKRKRAVDMYIDGFSIKQILEATGLKSPSEPWRLLQKCLSSDDYCNYKGYEALIRYKHIKNNNVRKKEQSTFMMKMGCTGMFMYLLKEYPDLKEYIDGLYFGKIKTTLEKNMTGKYIHERFLEKCRRLGIKEYEYPFNIKLKASRSLYKYLNSLKEQNTNQIRLRLSKDAYEKLTSTGCNQTSMPPEIRPFSVVQLDGHKMDLIPTIEIMTPKGDKETKSLQRCWLITLIDVATRVVLGYHLTIESAYDRFDVLKCIENAIKPKKLITFSIPGLEYPENTGFHSTAFPETEWAVFDELMLDNAKAHLSKDVNKQVTTCVNATLNFGPVASPETRGIIERFFQTIESRGYHRIVSTTGTGITDPRRRNAEKDAIKYVVKFEHIKELTEILIAQYNSTPHNANYGFSPLEVMQQRIAKGLLPNYIEEEERNDFMLNYITVSRKICGKVGTGRRPYVNFEGAEYRSDVLSKSFQLVGHSLVLKFNSDDIRTCKAFFEDGSEFCDLYVAGPWRNHPHSLDQRKSVNKLLNDKKLKDNSFIDPIKIYDDFLLDGAQHSKRKRNKYESRQMTEDKEKVDIPQDDYKTEKNTQVNILSSDELEARFKNQNNHISYSKEN